jgi:hypothetical protein
MQGQGRPYYVNPVGSPNPLNPPGLKIPKRPPILTQHEQQVAEIRNQGTSNEVNFSVTAAQSPSVPPMPTPATTVITRGSFDSHLYFDSVSKKSADYSKAQVEFQTRGLNNNTDLINIIQLRIFPFYFPRPQWPQPLQPLVADYLYLRRIYMHIPELATTTSVGTEGPNQSQQNPFHFEFDVENISSIAVRLTPVRDMLYFASNVQSLSTMTIQFLQPPYMTPLILYPDILGVTMGAGPTQWLFSGAGDYAAVSTEYAALTAGVLATQVAVWFGQLAPAPTGSNITRPEGWFISAMTATAPFGGFTLSTLPTGVFVAGTTAQAQLRKNRFAFEMRFTQMQTPTATGIVPTHV